MNRELIGKYNAFLAQIKAGGTLNNMNRHWFDEFDQSILPKVPDIPLSEANGPQNIATAADLIPFYF
jgi:hypothetical protein